LSARDVRKALWHARNPRPWEGHQIAPDIFGHYQLRPAPRFLLDLDYGRLAGQPEVVPDFLEKMSLTRPAPTAEELENLGREPGMVSRGTYTADPPGRRWAPNRPRGELPNELVAPNIRHSIWLGGPLTDPQGKENLAEAAEALGDRGQVVLWTDVSRQEVEQAALHPDTQRLAAIANFVQWAKNARVLLVDVFEVFHRDAPMINTGVLLAEAALRRGYGYAAASNILRLEIMNLLGGMYFDHDEPSSGDLAQTLTSVLKREPGYAVHGRPVKDPDSAGVWPGTAILMGPAEHRMWRSILDEIGPSCCFRGCI